MTKRLLLGCFILALSSLVLTGAALAQGNATPEIRIVRPVQNGVVPVDQAPIQISVSNYTLGPSNPWQVYLDDRLLATVGTGAISTTIPIAQSGPHVIRVALADPSGTSLASASVTVTAAPATPTGTWFNLAWSAPAFAVMTVGIILLILVSLRIARRPIEPEAG